MGREKERRSGEEEQIRMHAKKCVYCGQPLLSATEVSSKACTGCQSSINAD